MKKLAIIGALVLAIGASVTAGTMAKYTQTLEKETAVVTAKKFVIDQKLEAGDMHIAPGEKFEWEFSVDNFKGEDVSEVGIDLDITIHHDNDRLFQHIGKIKVIDMETGKKVKIGNRDANHIELLNQKFVAGKQETKKYKIVIDWPYENGEEANDKTDTELQGANTNLTVQIKGVQTK